MNEAAKLRALGNDIKKSDLKNKAVRMQLAKVLKGIRRP